MRVGINGMGRIGRLALRAAFGAAERPEDDPRAGNRLEVVHLNEVKGGAAATAHLLAFDSVQGRWRAPIVADGEAAIRVGDRLLGFSEDARPADNGPGDRDALLLPARQLRREVVNAGAQADAVERFLGPLPPLGVRHAPIEQGNLHVVEHAEVADQVKHLEDEADLLVAHRRQRAVRVARDG